MAVAIIYTTTKCILCGTSADRYKYFTFGFLVQLKAMNVDYCCLMKTEECIIVLFVISTWVNLNYWRSWLLVSIISCWQTCILYFMLCTDNVSPILYVRTCIILPLYQKYKDLFYLDLLFFIYFIRSTKKTSLFCVSSYLLSAKLALQRIVV